ncbi:hypothetical protein MXB_3357 [Myxobolus squamalis]|nr:hypothetical protein MXB_3357 [Myxobolus squamalis]
MDRRKIFGVKESTMFDDNTFSIVTIDEELDYFLKCISIENGVLHLTSVFAIQKSKDCYFDEKYYSMDEQFMKILLIRLRSQNIKS